MPIYEFKCEECGRQFEQVVFGAEGDHVTCPACKSEKTTKMMSVFASCNLSNTVDKGCSKNSGFS